MENTSTVEYIEGSGYISEKVRGPEYTWGFWVTGLESFATQKECPSSKNGYRRWLADGIPEGTLFTVAEYDGGSRVDHLFRFYVCEVIADNEDRKQELARYGYGWIEGNFRIVANGCTPLRATSLYGWWNKHDNPHTVGFAEHCDRHLKNWKSKKLPPMEDEPIAKTQKVIRVCSIDAVLDNWIKTEQ